MTVTVGTSGGNKAVGAIYVGTAGGNKLVGAGYVGTASGNKLFYSSLSLGVSPTSVVGTSSGVTVVSDSTTATPVGGVSPFTYSWAYVSGDATIVINSPTSATTTFQKAMAPATITSAVFKCTVTDAASQSATSVNVSVSLERV